MLEDLENICLKDFGRVVVRAAGFTSVNEGFLTFQEVNSEVSKLYCETSTKSTVIFATV